LKRDKVSTKSVAAGLQHGTYRSRGRGSVSDIYRVAVLSIVKLEAIYYACINLDKRSRVEFLW